MNTYCIVCNHTTGIYTRIDVIPGGLTSRRGCFISLLGIPIFIIILIIIIFFLFWTYISS